MLYCLNGDSIIRTRCLSYGIPYCVDTQISPPYLESWREGIFSQTFPKALRKMPGCEIVSYNMQVDHIHMVIIIPPKYSVSEVVGRLKGQTASGLRKKFGWLKEVYWKENIVWSPGYFVSTVGIEEEKILKYVEWQGRQDSGQTKFEF